MFSTASLVVDKGTFDAMTLASSHHSDGDRKAAISTLAASVKNTLKKILAPGNLKLFMITSCNLTRDELVSLFSPEFFPVAQVEHPSFVFGGVRGQSVTTIVFQFQTRVE